MICQISPQIVFCTILAPGYKVLEPEEASWEASMVSSSLWVIVDRRLLPDRISASHLKWRYDHQELRLKRSQNVVIVWNEVVSFGENELGSNEMTGQNGNEENNEVFVWNGVRLKWWSMLNIVWNEIIFEVTFETMIFIWNEVGSFGIFLLKILGKWEDFETKLKRKVCLKRSCKSRLRLKR